MPIRAKDPLPFWRFAEENTRKPTYPKSLVELAYEQLLSRLVTMQIAPGAPIRIEALSRDLEISQTPIREALTLLEAQKLAYKIPNVGFKATNLLTRDEIHDLFELRMLLEPKAAALAARRGDAAALAAIRELSKEADATTTDASDLSYARFAEGDAQLHQLIAVASGNRFLAETIEGLHVHLHIFRFLFQTNPQQKTVEEHSVLIEALQARDSARAERAMRAHLQASLGRIEAALEASGGSERPTTGETRGRSLRGSGKTRDAGKKRFAEENPI